MQKIFTFILLSSVVVCFSCIAEGSQEGTVNENRAVSGYNSIYLADIGETTIIQGNKEGITIETSPKVLKLIKTSVEREILTVKISKNIFTSIPKNTLVKYTIYVKDLNSIRVAGNNYIKSDIINSKSVKIELSGSGVLNINSLNADEIKVDISGNGECNFKGVVGKQDIYLSGSGIYNAKELVTTKSTVTETGSGKVYINVVESLSVKITGSGIVEYTGSPKVEQSISGSGTVTAIN